MGLSTVTPLPGSIDQRMENIATQVRELTAAYTGYLKMKCDRYFKDKRPDDRPSSDVDAYLTRVNTLLTSYSELKTALQPTLSQQEMESIEADIMTAIATNQLKHTIYFADFQHALSEKINAAQCKSNEAHGRAFVIILATVIILLAVMFTGMFWWGPLLASAMAASVFFAVFAQPPIVVFAGFIGTALLAIPVSIALLKAGDAERIVSNLEKTGDATLDQQIEVDPTLKLKQAFFITAKSCISKPFFFNDFYKAFQKRPLTSTNDGALENNTTSHKTATPNE